MNNMQVALKHAEEEEKQFLQSISHDLKTPVMVIMSYAEAITEGIYMGTLEDTADTIKKEAIRLEKKIKQILYLNSLEFILQHEKETTPFRLDILVEELASKFRYLNQNFNWNFEMDEVSVSGNRDKLYVAIENIVENQMRFAESKVDFNLCLEGQHAILEIYNDGPQIDSDKVSRIFDYLYKDKKGNFGLGLAITKKIVDHHEGEISAVNRDDGQRIFIPLGSKSQQ